MYYEIIDVPYPTTSSLHGAIAGTLVRQKGPGPGPEPRYHFEPAHHFEVLTDLAEAARPYPGDVVFLSCPTGCSVLLVVFDIEHPKAGSCSMAITRHPDFLRWWWAIPMDHPYSVRIVRYDRRDLTEWVATHWSPGTTPGCAAGGGEVR